MCYTEVMKAVMLYRPNSERARLAEDYVADFARNRHEHLELINIDSQEGSHLAELYGITDNPAILVTREDGQLLQHWQGQYLPLANELAGYMNM